jgi:predicted flap endonuclease-1-like 5' DNA nuclease
MFEVASLIVTNLLIALIIGIVLGYIIAKANNPAIKTAKTDTPFEIKMDSKNIAAINPMFKRSSPLHFKPLVLSFPRPTGKDNLKKIKGINTKIETDLNNLGIYHFDQIAKWSNKNAEWVEAYLSIPGCAKNNQWIDQAKILQTGNETIYSQKVMDGEIEVD